MKQKQKPVFHYDREADVLGVSIRAGREEEFVEVAPNVSVELDRKGNVIGFEILNASKLLTPLMAAVA